MHDLAVAIGLVFAIEGLLMAGFTETMRKRMTEVARLEPGWLRGLGLGAAVFRRADRLGGAQPGVLARRDGAKIAR